METNVTLEIVKAFLESGANVVTLDELDKMIDEKEDTEEDK